MYITTQTWLIFASVFQRCNSKLQLSTHLCGFPKNDKPRTSCTSLGVTRKYGGDSGWFDKQAVIIADGVGKWARRGVDPGIYSRILTEHIAKNTAPDDRDLVSHVKASYANLKALGTVGSSTLLYSRLVDPFLYTYNLGDCDLIVIRNNSILHAMGIQQFRFNAPYQLHVYGNSEPEDGNLSIIGLQKGDIVISASDGIWDNIPQEEMLNLAIPQDSQAMSRTIDIILNTAYRLSNDDDYASPFRTKYVEYLKTNMRYKYMPKLGKYVRKREKYCAFLSSSDERNACFADAEKYAIHDLAHGGKVDDTTIAISVVEEIPE